MTICILDNNPALCQVLETTLALSGYEVSTHTDSLTFMEAVQHRNIDDVQCIIVNVYFPEGQTGIDIISQVRQTHPRLPVLLISADPLPRSALRRFSNIVFCQKPFRLSTLLSALDYVQLNTEDPNPQVSF